MSWRVGCLWLLLISLVLTDGNVIKQLGRVKRENQGLVGHDSVKIAGEKKDNVDKLQSGTNIHIHENLNRHKHRNYHKNQHTESHKETGRHIHRHEHVHNHKHNHDHGHNSNHTASHSHKHAGNHVHKHFKYITRKHPKSEGHKGKEKISRRKGEIQGAEMMRMAPDSPTKDYHVASVEEYIGDSGKDLEGAAEEIVESYMGQYMEDYMQGWYKDYCDRTGQFCDQVKLNHGTQNVKTGQEIVYDKKNKQSGDTKVSLLKKKKKYRPKHFFGTKKMYKKEKAMKVKTKKCNKNMKRNTINNRRHQEIMVPENEGYEIISDYILD